MKVTLRNARLAFPDLFEAVQYQGQGEFNYRCTFLVPPDSQSFKDVEAAMAQVAADKWGVKAEAQLKNIKATNKSCFTDGDNKPYNGFAGNWALTATRRLTDGHPLLVDGRKLALDKADGKLYSGAYVNGIVDIWAQDNSFGKRINATLLTVQFVKDGDSFGGAAPVSEHELDSLPFEDEPVDEI